MTRIIAVFLSVVILILAVYAVGEHSRENLYHSQIQACQRGNVLRSQNNQQVDGLRLQVEVLRDFIRSAAKARLAAYERSGFKADRDAYNAYRQQHAALSELHFDKSGTVNCEKVIAK